MDHVSPSPPRCTNAWHSLAFKARKKKRMGERKKHEKNRGKKGENREERKHRDRGSERENR
jgi:hypothetical protein